MIVHTMRYLDISFTGSDGIDTLTDYTTNPSKIAYLGRKTHLSSTPTALTPCIGPLTDIQPRPTEENCTNILTITHHRGGREPIVSCQPGEKSCHFTAVLVQVSLPLFPCSLMSALAAVCSALCLSCSDDIIWGGSGGVCCRTREFR